MLTSILIILTILNGIQNEVILDIQHPYEMLNFDKSILTELKLHRQRRSIANSYGEDKQFEKEVDQRWKREIKKEDFNLDNYDRHLSEHANALHMYTKLPSNEFDTKAKLSKLISDDDRFKQTRLHNEIKHKTLDERLRNHHFKLNFNAHNREFKLLLKGKHHNDVFASNPEFESTTKGRFNYDTDNIINGILEDEKGSFVEGVITHDGLIDGLIKTNDEEFYIEPVRNYLKHDKLKINYENETAASDYHSIIYKLSDITFPNTTCEHHLAKRQVKGEPKSTNETQSIKALPLFSNSTIEPDLLNNKYLQAVRKHSIASKDKKPPKKPIKPTNNRKYYYKEIDALYYNSEAYGVRAIQRTHWTSDIDLQNHLVIDSKKST